MKNWVQYYGTLIFRQMLKILHIFPIKKNRVLFYSFNGKQYSCNPKQISDYLSKYCTNLEIIWAFKDPKLFEKQIEGDIKTVKFRSLTYYYYAKTSRVIVQNVQGFGELSRRKGQDVIQTWHASNGYKKQSDYVGLRKKIENLYHKDYTYVMSGSESMTLRRVRGTMGFDGTVLSGTPRMDVIINQNNKDIKQNVYNYFGLDKQTKLLLYAPTWRKDRNDNSYGLDYLQVYETVKNKFGGEWVILVRLHPNVYTTPDLSYSFTKNATQYPDMQDLLYTCDVLISDYSSCIWDYSFTYRPCFLFCQDIQKYGQDRDFDIPITQWHFPLSTNMDELVDIISNFDEFAFKEDMKLHHNEMGNLEDGHATQRVCSLIAGLCEEKCNEKI